MPSSVVLGNWTRAKRKATSQWMHHLPDSTLLRKAAIPTTWNRYRHGLLNSKTGSQIIIIHTHMYLLIKHTHIIIYMYINIYIYIYILHIYDTHGHTYIYIPHTYIYIQIPIGTKIRRPRLEQGGALSAVVINPTVCICNIPRDIFTSSCQLQKTDIDGSCFTQSEVVNNLRDHAAADV